MNSKKEDKDLIINEHGYTQYPKGHLGRSINVLRAMLELNESASSGNIATRIGLSSKSSVQDTIKALKNESLVDIKLVKNKFWKIENWGELYSEKLVLNYDNLLLKKDKKD